MTDPDRTVTWRRLRRPGASGALAALVAAAVAQSVATVLAGRLAQSAHWATLGALGGALVGFAVLSTAGHVTWAAVVDRAEGALRADLLTAALRQPLAALSELAVGEVLDRVDDDTHELGALCRDQLWEALGTVIAVVPMWIVAGTTWWPAWIAFPLMVPLIAAVIRRPSRELAERKVAEEAAWTDHAAVLEEGIAARDDLRTSLGRPYLLRRCAEASARVQRRVGDVVAVESRITLRAGGLLHVMLAALLVIGVALVTAGDLDVAALVTLFLVSGTLVNQIAQLARQLPELQAGMGAVVRVRQLITGPTEPAGGRPVPDGTLAVDFTGLRFGYPGGRFALRDVDLAIPAGATCALVGRTGSGKSTLAALLSRAVEPPPGSVYLGGVDVTELDPTGLRAAVGVVTQRTEILAGSLRENVALFADLPAGRVEAAIDELGLSAWVDGLPDGLDTVLGPGGTTLSAGEEQLVAFARLLVRDVRVVVLDEATARMDPSTEARVVVAAARLLAGRTAILVAHRLSTVRRADLVAVLDDGRIVDSGPRAELEARPGPFRRMLTASGEVDVAAGEVDEATGEVGIAAGDRSDHAGPDAGAMIGSARRTGPPPPAPDPMPGPGLAAGILRMFAVRPAWGLLGSALFWLTGMLGATGALTGFVWGRLVEDLRAGRPVTVALAAAVVFIAAEPLALSCAVRRFVPWWASCALRMRLAVLAAQTRQHRLPRDPPGEIVSRVVDGDRFLRYADRWNDTIAGLVIALVLAALGGSVVAGAIPAAVMAAAAAVSVAGRRAAGRSAAAASATRARFGRVLVSVLECARTVKLAAATADVRAHLDRVDGGRVRAAVREHRIGTALYGVPVLMVQVGVVAAWAVYLAGGWGLATALLVSGAVAAFDYFGSVAGAAITEAPGTRAWHGATTGFAGGDDLMRLPPGVDPVAGTAPAPPVPTRTPLRVLEVRDLAAVHDDGTRGVEGVDLTVRAGDMVLLVGQVGAGKSSLLAALCGLVAHTGSIRWNGAEVTDPQSFLRPARVGYVAQTPRVLSGTFADNVGLDAESADAVDDALAAAALSVDVAAAGGPDAVIGHRGVRLSGGQVQRLALARALAARPELLLADDVSSAVDAHTEIALWTGLRERGITVLGSTAKRAALARADTVVVLVDGAVAACGPWADLDARWGHLAS